jgi:hypothetical protein
MSRIFFSAAVLSITMLSTISGVAAIEPDFPCYLKTASGQIIDMTNMCAGDRTTIPRGTIAAPAQSQPDAEDDYKVQEGRDGAYMFEIWSNRMNNRFELKVWRTANYPNSQVAVMPRFFPNSVAALDHFECDVIRKPTATCPQNVRNRVPESNSTPRRRTGVELYNNGRR